MANSIFGANGASPTPAASKLGKTLITIPGGDNLVCQGAQWQFGRQVSAIHPLNLNKRILITGEPEGALTLSLIVGPSSGVGTFLRQYSDACNIASSGNNILLTPVDDCTAGNKRTRIVFTGLLLAKISGTMQRTAQGNLVIPTIQLMFVDMQYDD